MSFSAEINDFLKGYTAISSIVGDQEDRRDKRAAVKRATDKDEQDQMNDLAVDAETYLSPSRLAAAKRAPKKAKAAVVTTATPELYSPYGDDPGADENGVAMAAGGLVPDPMEEKKRSALPIDNATAAAARAAGKTSYSAGNGEGKSLVAMNGKARNTYGDTPSPMPAGNAGSLSKVFGDADKAIKDAMEAFKAGGAAPKQAIGGGTSDVDFVTNKGAATPEEVKAIDAKVDPDGTMDNWSKGRARLGYAYDYFVQRGEPEKATKVAQRLLMFDKMASEARGKIAVQLINGGDPGKGATVLMDAYNDNIHDGSTIDVKPAADGQFSFSISKEGKVVNEGTGSTSQLAELAGSVANGSEFTRRTARVAAGDGNDAEPDAGPDDIPAPGSAAANPPKAIPDAPAAADTSTPAPDSPTDETPKAKGKRDIAWAKKQYTYASSAVKTWEDEVKKNPTPENQARLKDAQIRLSEAEQDAIAIRVSTATKNSDKSKIMIDFDDDLAKWREAADPLAAPPPPPKDGLRGQPKPAAVEPAAAAVPGAVQATTAAPVTPAGNGTASYLGYKGGGSAWDAGDGQMVTGPQPGALKPMPPEIAAQAKSALTSKGRSAVVRMLLENGFNPSGL